MYHVIAFLISLIIPIIAIFVTIPISNIFSRKIKIESQFFDGTSFISSSDGSLQVTSKRNRNWITLFLLACSFFLSLIYIWLTAQEIILIDISFLSIFNFVGIMTLLPYFLMIGVGLINNILLLWQPSLNFDKNLSILRINKYFRGSTISFTDIKDIKYESSGDINEMIRFDVFLITYNDKRIYLGSTTGWKTDTRSRVELILKQIKSLLSIDNIDN